MAISDRTRKLLWGRSGNRCARCRVELTKNVDASCELSVVGEECHMVAQGESGPRAQSNQPKAVIDSYSNLILLCCTCHRLVDEQPELFPLQKLNQMKLEHEGWVQLQLNSMVNSNVSERQILDDFYSCFDRYAFRDPMCHEESESFIKAIRDTRIALTTGVVRLADKTIVRTISGKSTLHTSKYRDAFDEIVDLLRLMERVWDEAIINGDVEVAGGGHINHSEKFMQFMDDTRNKIIDLVNDVYKDLGKQPYPRIPVVLERKPGYGHFLLTVRRPSLYKGELRTGLVGFDAFEKLFERAIENSDQSDGKNNEQSQLQKTDDNNSSD